MINKQYFNASGIAREYYRRKNPERNYSNAQAYRNMLQDPAVDIKMLRQIVKDVCRDQLKNLANQRK